MSEAWDQWEKEAIKCTRCGSCQNVCPVFAELISEATVARGKVRLIRTVLKQDMEMTDSFAELMSQCLMCKACVANCPSGVRVDKLVEAARTELVRRRGMHPLKKFIFRVALKNRGIFHIGLRSGSLFQKLLFRPGPHGQGMLPRLPMGIDRRRMIKPIAPVPLRGQFPERAESKGSRGTVAFFTGCMMNYFYVDAGRAVVEVLNKLGYHVLIPARQHCCGTPARVNGDKDTAVALAKANLDVFADVEAEAVIVACASCGLAWKEEFAELLEDDARYQAKAQKLMTKVKDFNEFVAGLDGWEQNIGQIAARTTYHDPCHLARGQKIREQPRRIIRAISGDYFAELPGTEQCCGMAGSYSLYHYDTSKKINDKKIADIKATGAEIMLTSCPACLMQIEDGLQRNQLQGVQCMHVAELLNKALAADNTRQTEG